MNGFIIYLLVGSATGACLLARNWKRGGIYGVVLAALFYSVSGCGGDSAAMNQSTPNVTHITDTDFDSEVVQASQPVVVDCYATWCGPCRELAPIVDNLADEYAGKIKFVKVNVDESPKLAQQFKVEAIPTLLFFKDGELTGTSVGVLTKADLASRVEALMAVKTQPAAAGQ